MYSSDILGYSWVFLGFLGYSWVNVWARKKMHIKEIYVIFIHLFDSGILLIIDLKGHYLPNRKFLLLVKTIKYD